MKRDAVIRAIMVAAPRLKEFKETWFDVEVLDGDRSSILSLRVSTGDAVMRFSLYETVFVGIESNGVDFAEIKTFEEVDQLVKRLQEFKNEAERDGKESVAGLAQLAIDMLSEDVTSAGEMFS